MRRLEVTWPDVNDGYVYVDVISKRAHVGLSVLEFYSQHYQASGGQEKWSERIAAGEVTVNEQPTAATCILRQGDVCKYSRPPWSEPPAPNYLELIYEDSHVVAVSKPSGLQVMAAGPFFQRTALTILHQHFAGAATAGPGAKSPLLAVPTPVHRLGRGTSGTLLCARTPQARRQLSELMTHVTQHLPTAELQAHRPFCTPPSQPVAAAGARQQTGAGDPGAAAVHGAGVSEAAAGASSGSRGSPPAPAAEGASPSTRTADGGPPGLDPAEPSPDPEPRTLRKVYRTRCSGIIPHDEGLVDCPIGLVQHQGLTGGVHAACAVEAGGKAALSRYCVLHRDVISNSTLVEVEIFSGRPHQIRIHMACIGHPLVGDPMYGPGGLPQAGASGGVDGTADSSRPGDCGTYLLHAHVLDIPLVKLGLLGAPEELRLAKPPPSSGQEGWHAKIDAQGFLLLKAPLPMQLLTPMELECL